MLMQTCVAVTKGRESVETYVQVHGDFYAAVAAVYVRFQVCSECSDLSLHTVGRGSPRVSRWGVAREL